MNVTPFTDPNAFYVRVEPYLLANEAVHNLTLGLLSNIRQDSRLYESPLFALVEQGGDVQLVALMTPPRSLILSLAADPAAITQLAEEMDGMLLPGVNGPAQESRLFAETWSRVSGQSYHVDLPMRTFRLGKVIPVTGVSGRLRRAAPGDRDLLVQWELAFYREAFADQQHALEEAERAVDNRLRSTTGGMYIWNDGGAVSFLGYGGPTPNGMRIGPVYTPPEQRGHGYASACVAEASQRLLDAGRKFCFLFTDLRNPTSNHIYQAIGYEPVADFTSYRFDTA